MAPKSKPIRMPGTSPHRLLSDDEASNSSSSDNGSLSDGSCTSSGSTSASGAQASSSGGGGMYAASPGAGSYVTAPDSWCAVPPPMLGASFEARGRPSFRPPPPRIDYNANAEGSARQTRRARRRERRRRRRDGGTTLPPKTPTRPTGEALAVSFSENEAASWTDRGGVLRDRVEAVQAVQAQVSQAANAGTAPSRPANGTAAAAAAAVGGDDGGGERRPVRAVRAGRSKGVGWRVKVAKMAVQWRAIMNAPRELAIVFVLKFLSSYAYFSFALVMVMFLTNEFGFSDNQAGWAYGMYGVMSTVFGFACGWVIDYLGVRTSLLIGGLVGGLSRLVLAFTKSSFTAQVVMYIFLPFSECLGIPVMSICIKRYTNAHNRTFAFSIFYSMMNIAALFAGPLVDLSRFRFAKGITFDMHPVGFDAVIHITSLRIVVFSSAIAAAAMLIGVAMGIREIEVDDQGNVSAFTPDRSSPMDQTMEVLREPAFWRLTLFTLLIVGVRLVFRHLDCTMPKYLVRQFGPDAPFGLIYSINPFVVIWLVPVVALMTRHVDSFTMILVGSFISALSPFWISVGEHYWTVILFMVTLSIGEAVYSPRVYEYTMEVSGHGKEGLYSSLSTAPLFSVKLLVGGMSGWLLTTYMPADDVAARDGQTLWTIIGLTSLTSPILMFMFKNYISPPEEQAARSASRKQPVKPRGTGGKSTRRRSDAGADTPFIATASTPLLA